MHLQASTTESELASIFRKASVHCRRDHLWKSLHDGLCDYSSFTELLKFVHTEEIVMPKLLPITRQRGQSDSQKWFRLVHTIQFTKVNLCQEFLSQNFKNTRLSLSFCSSTVNILSILASN